MSDDIELEIRRLRWQCRRGMLELDFLFERYLDDHYAAATSDDRAAFQELLSLQDPILNEWLVTGAARPDEAFIGIVNRVRGETDSAK